MRKYILAIASLMLLIGCSTLKVQTDYNSDFNFKSLSKFAVIYSKKKDGKDFTRDQIGRVITKHFQDKGYSLVSKSSANFYVAFHLNIETKKEVETNYETMDLYPVRGYEHRIVPIGSTQPAYAYDPYRLPLDRTNTTTRVSTQTFEYREGKLLVEVIDAKSNSVVWQGTAKDELSDLSTPQEKSAYANMVITKLLENFPSR